MPGYSGLSGMKSCDAVGALAFFADWIHAFRGLVICLHAFLDDVFGFRRLGGPDERARSNQCREGRRDSECDVFMHVCLVFG